MTRTVLVTGGAGFIGSHVVDALLAAGGFDVRVLDDFSTGKRENLAHCAGRIHTIEGDVRDQTTVAEALDGAWGVVHLAAIASVTLSLEDPGLVNDVNVGGTVAIANAAGLGGVGSLVFASSCAVYGDARELPIAESAPVTPLSPYAASKLAGEHYCRVLGQRHRMRAVCLRFFNVYGPRQDPRSEYSGVISRFATAALAGTSCTVYGDGLQSRDFVYVADVADACLRALTTSSPHAGGPVNVGMGKRSTLLDVVASLRQSTGSALPVQHDALREGDIRHSQADITRARQWLGYAPSHELEAGLVETLQWYRGDGRG
jgi:UDP-glucose 4-epimerase